mmetsp:Transcript_7769/g.20974  ORF Transcript_7769/g.20974 Transcript_7769/m.20974 type:complete len:264 (+) Transcript_7769:33-824(+)
MLWFCCAEDAKVVDSHVATVRVLEHKSGDAAEYRGQPFELEEDDDDGDFVADEAGTGSTPDVGAGGGKAGGGSGNAPLEFAITLRRPDVDTPWGFEYDFSDAAMLHICGIEEGSTVVSAANAQAPEDSQLRLNDFVLAVDGVRDHAAKMTEKLMSHRELTLLVRRPLSYAFQLHKNGSSVGLDLRYAQKGRSLVVDAILPGRVQVWNAENPDKEVTRHDRIIEVNGHSGVSLDLLDIIARAESLNLVFLRAVRPEGAPAGREP